MDSVDLGSLAELDDFEPGLAFDNLLDLPPGGPPGNVRAPVGALHLNSDESPHLGVPMEQILQVLSNLPLLLAADQHGCVRHVCTACCHVAMCLHSVAASCKPLPADKVC